MTEAITQLIRLLRLRPFPGFAGARSGRVLLLALAMGTVVPTAQALDVFHLDPVINHRWSSGNYKDGNLQENPHFLLAGHDLSGIGWDQGNFGMTLISPRHFVTAAHVAPLPGRTVSFLNLDGVIKHYIVESVYYVEHSAGVRTDLVVGRLTQAIPPEDHVGYFPTMRLPSDKGYTGIKVYSFGIYQACGKATIAHWGAFDLLPFNLHDHVDDDTLFIMEWHPFVGQAQAQGNDSGSPTFVVYQGKVALIGIHTAVDVSRLPYLTADVLIPAYFTQIQERLALDGFDFGNVIPTLSVGQPPSPP